MWNKLKVLPLIVLLAIVPTLAVWFPFFFRIESFWTIPLPSEGIATIIKNYDGPLYIAVAKTFYNLETIRSAYSFPLPVEYYASHFPLFPALIRLFSPLLGYPYSMLFVTLLGSILTTLFFYLLMSKFVEKNEALWLTFVFSFFPARWLIVKSVGSPEPLFVGSLIASVYFFREKKYWLAGIWGAMAQLTKSPGVLLFVAYIGAILFPKIQELGSKRLIPWIKSLEFRAYPIVLVPISLGGIFVLYSIKFGNFWAYFNSGDNIHLFFPPFQIFNYSAPWVGTFWLEEVVFIYLFGILGILRLMKQKEHVLAWFTGIFFASLVFVSHRDLMRYAIPIVPFLFVAFRQTLIKKEFKAAFVFILLPIYLFALAYISQNTMPISNWAPFL